MAGNLFEVFALRKRCKTCSSAGCCNTVVYTTRELSEKTSSHHAWLAIPTSQCDGQVNSVGLLWVEGVKLRGFTGCHRPLHQHLQPMVLQPLANFLQLVRCRHVAWLFHYQNAGGMAVVPLQYRSPLQTQRAIVCPSLHAGGRAVRRTQAERRAAHEQRSQPYARKKRQDLTTLAPATSPASGSPVLVA